MGKLNKEEIQEIADSLADMQDVLIIGRTPNEKPYLAALEGSDSGIAKTIFSFLTSDDKRIEPCQAKVLFGICQAIAIDEEVQTKCGTIMAMLEKIKKDTNDNTLN